MVTLKNHQVWQDLSEIFTHLDAHSLVLEHLELSNYKIAGYWDESDQFYETITLPRPLSPELVTRAIAFHGDKRRIQLKFVLNLAEISPETISRNPRIGELMLIYDENLELIDENWQIDIHSPFINTNPSL
ncbi:hypothetical protein [Laspinema olomoucense]|uniref:hypothetical protein n=1 Tax=Laspinema olomoucense TaxID=3231600 RepID=UPI0021BBB1E1|nr:MULTISPECIES: hypothetical protein [unclassified Laspinema]MCT7972991.1 hypothetical protein [Laspinema sp. D3d]MCT7987037.1 hypothetical protein [Laspinema sp. D3a]MCT7994256.1 hypothetical protein [Laspinema sp. D3c]